MSELKEKPFTEPTSPRRSKSFKAVIVVTRHDAQDPTLRDVEESLAKAQLAYSMPAEISSPVVISFSVGKEN